MICNPPLGVSRRAVWLLSVLSLGLVLFAAFEASAEPAKLDLDRYRGKVVVLDFWASWCVPCRRSFPWLNDMHARYADDGLVIVGVNLDNDPAEARAFLDEYPPDFQIYYDETRELAKRYDVIAMPSSYVIGRDGEVFKRHLGFKVKRQDEYERVLVEALGE